MEQHAQAVVSTAVVPPLFYIALFTKHNVIIDEGEFFVKQTHRSRFKILGANGVQILSIPIAKKEHPKTPVHAIKISYAENWPRKYLQAIQSAYGSAPFYEFYETEFEKLWLTRHDHLVSLNHSLLSWCFQKLKISPQFESSETYVTGVEPDFRGVDFTSTLTDIPAIPYKQVFHYKQPFIPHLSVLDFIFNGGRL